ncbi:hypothetical protein [Litoribrevibacter albus]|uniref:Tetratricopeptide repeat protein n=1 Tax=Litoribrevibacter albus TaxID=1473156 RepID=A0AA37SCC6_9GAMM|nr:hypothetical protein [Litoribrevibacter albus]GLQ32716.1 hypothetical protein GCM10007876_31950 [Litoribrevibacter albus]
MVKWSMSQCQSAVLDSQGMHERQDSVRVTVMVALLICALLMSPLAMSSSSGNSAPQIRKTVLPLVLDIQTALNPEATEENSTPAIDISHAEQLIQTLLERDLTNYEQALAHQFAATLALEKKDYQGAFDAFHNAWLLEVYAVPQQLQIQRTLAQLAMQLGKWQTSVDFYVPWIEAINGGEFETKVSAQDYVYVAQSYYRLETWPDTVRYVDNAIGASQNPIPESWYRMKLTGLLNQYEPAKQYEPQSQNEQAKQAHSQAHSKHISKTVKESLRRQAVDVSKILVREYPSTLYWRQLALLHQQGDQPGSKDQNERKALSALHSAYVAGFLTAEQDLMWMITLMIQQGNYYQAGTLLEMSLNEQRIAGSESHLKTLADTWIMAKDYARAETTLTALVKLNDEAQYRKTLSDVQAIIKAQVKAES